MCHGGLVDCSFLRFVRRHVPTRVRDKFMKLAYKQVEADISGAAAGTCFWMLADDGEEILLVCCCSLVDPKGPGACPGTQDDQMPSCILASFQDIPTGTGSPCTPRHTRRRSASSRNTQQL